MIDKNKLLKFYELKNLIRFGLYFRLKDETVAEHSFYVTLFTRMICYDLEVSHNILIHSLTYALIHDIPEIEVGDIVHPAKEKNSILDVAVKTSERIAMSKIMPQFLNLYKDVNDGMYEQVRLIVQLADVLSVIQYALLEIKMGNKTINFILEDDLKRYSNIQDRIKILFGKYVECFELEE